MRVFIAIALAWLLAIAGPSSAQMTLTGAGGVSAPKASGGCSDSNETAWAAAVVSAGGTVSGAQATRVCTLIQAYKSAGTWATYDRIWLFAAENVQQATIDLVHLATWTILSSPTFAANVGYTGDLGAGINSNFTPSTAGGNYTQNSAHLSAYVKASDGTTSHAAIGANDGGNFSYMEPSASGIAFDINGASFPGGTDASGIGQYIATRTSSTNVAIYKNGNTTPIGSSSSDNSGAISTIPFYILSINTFGHPSAATIAAITIGGGMTSTQMTASASAMNAYQTAIGNNVY